MKDGRHGILGHLSRLPMVVFGAFDGSFGGRGASPAPGLSLTNRDRSAQRPRPGLPGKSLDSGPGRSLNNILWKGPNSPNGRRGPPAGDIGAGGRKPADQAKIEGFYRAFLLGILRHQPEIRGIGLQSEILLAIEEARSGLPARSRACVPDLRDIIPGHNPPAGTVLPVRAADIEAIRAANILVIQRIIDRLSTRLDPTVLKLLVRLAARDALKEGSAMAEEHSLFEGIPEDYLRQVDE